MTAEGEISNSQIADITVKMAYHASKVKEHQLELRKLQKKRTKLITKILEQEG
jgi:hypothetical protein